MQQGQETIQIWTEGQGLKLFKVYINTNYNISINTSEEFMYLEFVTVWIQCLIHVSQELLLD